MDFKTQNLQEKSEVQVLMISNQQKSRQFKQSF
jgi:hypothetical protein